jgi:hypothetical protein
MNAATGSAAGPSPDANVGDGSEELAPATGRALVPVSFRSGERALVALWHSHAPFIAQLIATAAGLAQTRVRRRRPAVEASGTYSAMNGQPAFQRAGRRFSRAV